jgi:hypothetical protein
MRRIRGVLATVLVTLALWPTAAHAQHYAEKNAWRFDNFKDAQYPWEIYRETFIGIPPTKDPWSSAFDVLFYDQVYKNKLSENGNCYGLSLMSLMMLKNGGHLGYCLPIPQYSGDIFGSPSTGPSDPGLKRAINTMHGHQVNLPTLQHILDIISKSKNRDAEFAFVSFQASKMKNDPTLVSITKSLNPADGGHTMVAYDAQDLGGGNRRIYVYDPNRTWADPADRAWYQTGQNFVAISGHSWSFTMQSSGTWSGSPASGGNLIIIPISITGPHSRSPASLGDQIIGQILTAIFISGDDAEIEQVTDGRGRRLFKPSTLEVDADPSTGMLKMLPWYPSDQVEDWRRGPLILFHLGNSAGALEVQLKAGPAGYTLRSLGPRGMITVSARGGQGMERLTLHHPGTGEPRVALRNGRGALEYDVQFAQVIHPRERLHVLRAARLRVPEGESVDLAIGDRSRALIVQSRAAALGYDLELRAVTRRGEEVLSRSAVGQEALTTRMVRPRDWHDLKSRDVLYQPLPQRTSPVVQELGGRP